MACGADGVVLKTAPVPELLGAIRAVARGGFVVDPDVARSPAGGALLTVRETDVLQLLAEGLGNHEISERLFISSSTVKRHVENIARKLGVSHRGGMVAEAFRRGLLA